MQGTGYEAVVLHRKCPVTKHIPQDRLAPGKKMVIKTEIKIRKMLRLNVSKKSSCIPKMNKARWISPFLYE